MQRDSTMNCLSFVLLNLFLIYHANSQITNQEITERTLKIQKLGIYKDAISSPVSMIRKHKYPVKKYDTKTKDGYILTMLRIPHERHSVKKNGIPVLLMSGLSVKLNVFVNYHDSLGYFLVKHGYDVWLGNKRSTLGYSRHVKYSKLSSKYWDFSWEEVGMYDVPSMIDTILRITGYEQVIVISYSMSAASVLALQATSPEYNTKVATHVSLGPVAYAQYKTTVLAGFIVPFYKILKTLYDLLIVGEGVINYFTFVILGYVTPALCLLVGDYLCQATAGLFIGYHPGMYGSKIIISAGNIMAGTSFKTGLHLMQQVKLKGMRRYDYGTRKNLKLYGTKLPPAFNLSQITCPTTILYGANDAGATPLNIELLARDMKSARKVMMDYPMYNHADFAWAVDPTLKIDMNSKVFAAIKDLKVKRKSHFLRIK